MEKPGQVKKAEPYFTSKAQIITKSTDLSEMLDEIFEERLEQISVFQKNGSGWIFDYIVSFDISIVPYEPIKESSYIPLPSSIAHKKAVINVKNLHDHKCLLYMQ